ncbi:MAG: helix-turn-helix transcriptional regulator [Alphaproteobacteria bacterium]|nr:helix-turn-helix transcriptional regulator [Alphaproteobacteria bacterium]
MDAIVAHANAAESPILAQSHGAAIAQVHAAEAVPAAVAAARAFDALPVAIAVLDPRGKLITMNASARCDQRFPVAVARNGVMMARRVVSDRRAVGVTHRDSTGALWLVAAPLAQIGGLDDLVIVAATDPAATHPIGAQVIGDLCGLTRAEAQTAQMVLAGGTPKTIARALGVSLATVKTHLHRVFTKTETTGQADLSRRLARILAPTPADAAASIAAG